MENTGVGNSPWTYIIVTIVVLVLFQVVLYVMDLLKDKKPKKDSSVKNDVREEHRKEKAAVPVQKQKKKPPTNWKSKGSFAHQYLATNLMGHTGQILDMESSSDGKYLISCAEDDRPPDSGSVGSSSSSSGSEAGSEGARGSSPVGDTKAPRNKRRRQKPRPSAGLAPAPVPAPAPAQMGPLSRYLALRMSEKELASRLEHYLLSGDQMSMLGYPIESETKPLKAVIYAVDFSKATRRFDVNAREFVPGCKSASWSPGGAGEDDSGRGSGSSSPHSQDSGPDSEEERAPASAERRCVRCSRGFLISADGQYLTRERCRYHWGRRQRAAHPAHPAHLADSPAWTCCGGAAQAPGCARAPLHVWSGTCAGRNGPLDGYVRTAPRAPGSPRRRVVAVDCEMCFTAAGLQVARLEVVAADGRPLYGTYVLPESPVVDYNTRFSGIRACDLRKATKTLREVQSDLLGLVDADTILVGHGLENDLRALRLLHGRVVDTAVSFPHARGLPYRRSLRQLAQLHLERPVQEDTHCPLEDSRASLELMLWRVERDFA